MVVQTLESQSEAAEEAQPLKVALVIKNSNAPKQRDRRNVGYWSYPVPEFEWDHFFGDGIHHDLIDYKRAGYDFVFHEDGGNWFKYANRGSLPLIYYSVDSTLTGEHMRVRFEQSKQADLVLLDHDRPSRFKGCNRPVRQWNYCVNDRVFNDPKIERTLDVVFHCSGGKFVPGTDERREVRQFLHDFCDEHGLSYQSGVLGLPDYARAMASAKIVVNWPRTKINRPHRVFDAMACGGCLVTGLIPPVIGDDIMPGEHFVTFDNNESLSEAILSLLASGEWVNIAARGHALVMERHTWATRATQLRQIVREEFGI